MTEKSVESGEHEQMHEPVSPRTITDLALGRRIEAKERDRAQQGVESGSRLHYLMRSPGTDLVPLPHERICLVPMDAGWSYNDIQSLKVYIPVDNSESVTVASADEIFVSIRKSGSDQRLRYHIDEAGVTQFLRYDAQHRVVAPPISEGGNEQQIMEDLIAVLDPNSEFPYALATQQKKGPLQEA